MVYLDLDRLLFLSFEDLFWTFLLSRDLLSLLLLRDLDLFFLALEDLDLDLDLDELEDELEELEEDDDDDDELLRLFFLSLLQKKLGLLDFSK